MFAAFDPGCADVFEAIGTVDGGDDAGPNGYDRNAIGSRRIHQHSAIAGLGRRRSVCNGCGSLKIISSHMLYSI